MPNLWCMSATDEKAAFAARLLEVCAEKGMREGRGILTQLAAEFGVSANAARKWIRGAGLPELETCIAIAKWGDVNLEWLLTGRGLKRGVTLDTRVLAVGEAISALSKEDRHELLDYLKYKIERNTTTLFTESQAARYRTAVAAFESDDINRRTPPPLPRR